MFHFQSVQSSVRPGSHTVASQGLFLGKQEKEIVYGWENMMSEAKPFEAKPFPPI